MLSAQSFLKKGRKGQRGLENRNILVQAKHRNHKTRRAQWFGNQIGPTWDELKNPLKQQ